MIDRILMGAVLVMMSVMIWASWPKAEISSDFLHGYYMGKTEVLDEIRTIYMPAAPEPIQPGDY